jgi:hypothetical protein
VAVCSAGVCHWLPLLLRLLVVVLLLVLLPLMLPLLLQLVLLSVTSPQACAGCWVCLHCTSLSPESAAAGRLPENHLWMS